MICVIPTNHQFIVNPKNVGLNEVVYNFAYTIRM